MLKTSDILYNPYKHHLSFVINAIQNSDSIEALLPFIKTMGSSKMDMYYGKIQVADLFNDLIKQIPANDENDFKQWISSNNSFQTIKLTDQSTLVIRYAAGTQFIHLHPGRYSIDTVRVSANVIKTAVIAVAALNHSQIMEINTETINELRTSLLELSPIANLEKSDQINLLNELLSHSSQS